MSQMSQMKSHYALIEGDRLDSSGGRRILYHSSNIPDNRFLAVLRQNGSGICR